MGGKGDRVAPSLATDGPGAPTLRGLGTFQTHPCERSNTPMGPWPGELVIIDKLLVIIYNTIIKGALMTSYF